MRQIRSDTAPLDPGGDPRSRGSDAKRPAKTGRSQTASSRRGLDRLDVRGVRALGALRRVVGHLRALRERPKATAGDPSVMHKQILALVIGGDEAKALLVAESFDGSSCHLFPPGRSCGAKRRRRCSDNSWRDRAFVTACAILIGLQSALRPIAINSSNVGWHENRRSSSGTAATIRAFSAIARSSASRLIRYAHHHGRSGPRAGLSSGTQPGARRLCHLTVVLQLRPTAPSLRPAPLQPDERSRCGRERRLGWIKRRLPNPSARECRSRRPGSARARCAGSDSQFVALGPVGCRPEQSDRFSDVPR
jgi:hypothetical protein